MSKGFIDGFYYKPRVDAEYLQKHNEGLICLSGCIGGEIPQALLENNFELAKKIACRYQEIFGKEDFYIEIQDHGLQEEMEVNSKLIALAREIQAPLVATNDVHYIKKEDAVSHDVLLCIQTGTNVQEEDRMRFPVDEFYLKSPAEMEALFGNIPEALENTIQIAERCNVDFDFSQLHLPNTLCSTTRIATAI